MLSQGHPETISPASSDPKLFHCFVNISYFYFGLEVSTGRGAINSFPALMSSREVIIYNYKCASQGALLNPGGQPNVWKCNSWPSVPLTGNLFMLSDVFVAFVWFLFSFFLPRQSLSRRALMRKGLGSGVLVRQDTEETTQQNTWNNRSFVTYRFQEEEGCSLHRTSGKWGLRKCLGHTLKQMKNEREREKDRLRETHGSKSLLRSRALAMQISLRTF